MSDYRIYRYYPSGNVVFCGVFSNAESAMKAKRELEAKNPFAEYQIHER